MGGEGGSTEGEWETRAALPSRDTAAEEASPPPLWPIIHSQSLWHLGSCCLSSCWVLRAAPGSRVSPGHPPPVITAVRPKPKASWPQNGSTCPPLFSLQALLNLDPQVDFPPKAEVFCKPPGKLRQVLKEGQEERHMFPLSQSSPRAKLKLHGEEMVLEPGLGTSQQPCEANRIHLHFTEEKTEALRERESLTSSRLIWAPRAPPISSPQSAHVESLRLGKISHLLLISRTVESQAPPQPTDLG